MQSSWIEQRAVRKTMDLVEKARMSSGFDDEILTGVLRSLFQFLTRLSSATESTQPNIEHQPDI